MAGTDNGAQQGAEDPGQQSTNPSPDNGAQQRGPKGQPDEGQKQKRESYEVRIKDLEEQLKASKDREASLNADLEKALSQDDGLTTSQFVTAPKRSVGMVMTQTGLTTSQFVTAPKRRLTLAMISKGLTTSQFVTAPKRLYMSVEQ